MQLIFLDTLKAISGYADIRSIRTWLAGLGTPLLHIGKNYAVDKALFEKQLAARYKLTIQKRRYRPATDTEQAFLEEVKHLLSEHTELPSDR